MALRFTCNLLFQLYRNNFIGKLTVDRERDSIAKERRVVTTSWKRLGIVSGLRRTSTLPVVDTFSRLCYACAWDVASLDIERFRIETEKRLMQM
jgi:hypothetical protein